MKSSASALYLMALGLVGSALSSTNSTLDALIANSTANLQAILEARVSNASATCTSENVVYRKEWSTLTSDEKLEYIGAVKCLMTTDAITPSSAAPGVRSRFDDFGAYHVNSTTWIHWTSYFFSWHRHYTWMYETALRDECGYNGTQPYWDWPLTATAEEHPLFDGSETSMSGNGVAVEHNATTYLPTPNVTMSVLPAGTGGGCIKAGPFANMTVNLGPHGLPMADGLVYNPRCVTRDFRDWYLQEHLSYDNITNAVIQPDLQSLSNVMQAQTGGLHDGGHLVVGGLQDDLWASPQDPYFFFHHSQIDRIWTMWQGLDYETRIKEISDTVTIKNLPPSANGTIDLPVTGGYLGPTYTIEELSSTIDGPFCYLYL